MATRAGDPGLDSGAALPLLFEIEGEAVTGVEFFGADGRDILLRFGAARLEVLSKAVVRAGPTAIEDGDPAWRVALLRFVEARVRHIDLERGRELSIDFDNGHQLVVSLLPEHRSGPEAAAFFDESWVYEPY